MLPTKTKPERDFRAAPAAGALAHDPERAQARGDDPAVGVLAAARLEHAPADGEGEEHRDARAEQDDRERGLHAERRGDERSDQGDDEPDGDPRPERATLDPSLGLKAGGYWPNNLERRGLINHQSTVFLFDPDTGRMRAMVGGNLLTALRTAAASLASSSPVPQTGPTAWITYRQGKLPAPVIAADPVGMVPQPRDHGVRVLDRGREPVLRRQPVLGEAGVDAGATGEVRHEGAVATRRAEDVAVFGSQ